MFTICGYFGVCFRDFLLPLYVFWFAIILNIDLNINFVYFQNGFVSALPYLCMWLFSMFISVVADWMLSSGRFNHAQVRKIINSIGEHLIDYSWVTAVEVKEKAGNFIDHVCKCTPNRKSFKSIKQLDRLNWTCKRC